jgi:hypothetical protein
MAIQAAGLVVGHTARRAQEGPQVGGHTEDGLDLEATAVEDPEEASNKPNH